MDPFTIFMLVALFGLMYFMLIRPAQKKAREQQQLVSSIQPGSRVMTGSGIFATVRHVGDLQAIIEISPGVELTVAKQAILRTVRPEEDEFEYDDEDAPEALEEAADEESDAAASDSGHPTDAEYAEDAAYAEHHGAGDEASDHEVAAEDAQASDRPDKR